MTKTILDTDDSDSEDDESYRDDDSDTSEEPEKPKPNKKLPKKPIKKLPKKPNKKNPKKQNKKGTPKKTKKTEETNEEEETNSSDVGNSILLTIIHPSFTTGSNSTPCHNNEPSRKRKLRSANKKNKKRKIVIQVQNPKPVHNLKDLIDLIECSIQSLSKKKCPKRKKVAIETQLTDLKNLIAPLQNLQNMIGLTKFKTEIVNQLLLFLQELNDKDMFLHSVITGAPGVGKTTLCHILAKIYKFMGFLPTDKVTVADRPKLIGQYLGETSIKTKRVLESALGGVLLIDEAYALGNNEGRDSFSKECIDCINQFLSEHVGEFVCIIAGYEKELDECFFSRNAGLRRRFPWQYDLPSYAPKELVQIFCLQAKEQDWKILPKEDKLIELFTKHKHLFKGNGGDTKNVLDKSKICHARRVFGRTKSDKVIQYKDIVEGLNSFKKKPQTQTHMSMYM